MEFKVRRKTNFVCMFSLITFFGSESAVISSSSSSASLGLGIELSFCFSSLFNCFLGRPSPSSADFVLFNVAFDVSPVEQKTKGNML